VAAAVSVSGGSELRTTRTISGTGFAATTAYEVRVTTPSGSVRMINVTTDGAGAFTVTDVPQTPGTSTVDVRPVTETTGTTTATATATHKSK